MGGHRGTFVWVAWAVSLLLLSVSLCTCITVTYPKVSDVLSKQERITVYGALEDYVNNVNGYIIKDRDYHAGRLFTNYIALNGKGVVIRFTRWTEECSVDLSDTQTIKGSDLLAAWKALLKRMRPYLKENDQKGYEWVAVSDHTDWIDYYVLNDYPAILTDNPPFYTDNIGGDSSVTDCAIQPSMMLSHYNAPSFSRLLPGQSLYSPDRKYKLTIPRSTAVQKPCVLNFQDARTGEILWNSDAKEAKSQSTCVLAFLSDGRLELWNEKKPFWVSEKACANLAGCAGAASLALMDDGHVKLYRSLGNNLAIYWSVPN